MTYQHMMYRPWSIGDRVRVTKVGPYCGRTGSVISVDPPDVFEADSGEVYRIEMDSKQIGIVYFEYWDLDIVDGVS